MPKATLTLTIPDEVWIGELTRRYPEAEFRVLAALADERSGVGLAEIVAPDSRSVVAALDECDAVTDIAILEHRGESILVQVETTHPLLLEPARRSGIPLEMPFSVQAGEAVWELTASRDRLSKLRDQLDAFEIPFTVESIYRELDSTQLLTDHQWQVLDTAIREGYYDTPRRCTQAELAERLDLAKSTCSETLHRAEERVIKRFMDRQSRDIDRTTASQPLTA